MAFTEERMRSQLTKAMALITNALGSFPAIFLVVILIAAWFVGGVMRGFDDSWQLLVNTPTTIVTSIMAFVIQNTQNRDGRAIQTKLDAILEALDKAPNDLVDLEEETEPVIKERQREIHERALNE